MLLAARQGLASRRRLLWAVWYGGAAVVALGGLAAMGGRWSVAIALVAVGALALWLTGAWVWPLTHDSYARNVMRVLNDWSAYTASSDGRYEHQLARTERRLAALSPPEGVRGAHDRLIALGAESAAAWHDEATPLAERARRETAAVLAASELLESVRASAITDAERHYFSDLSQSHAARRELYEAAAADTDRATTDAAHRLERITPPPAAAADHEALVAALHDHLTTTRELRAAREALDPARAAAAGSAWDDATRRIQDHAQRIADGAG